MKYFLCVFDTIYLGIPSACTERVISVSREQSSVFESDNRDAFISLPLLFGRADISAPHGIVLKGGNSERTVTLLAPPLDIDLEIPDKDILTVPKSLSGRLRYCKGVCFIKKDNEERLVFIIDVEKLTGDYR